MYCTNCGAQMEDGQRFCSNCGADLGASPNGAAGNGSDGFYGDPFADPQPSSFDYDPGTPGGGRKKGGRKKGGKAWIAIVLAVLVLGLGAFAAFRWKTVVNLVDRTFSSPEEYFRKVETRHLQEKALQAYGAEGLSKMSPVISEDGASFLEEKFQLSLNTDVLESEWLDEIEDSLGFDVSWFRNIGFYMSTGLDGDLTGGNLTLFLNDKDVIDGDYTVDRGNSAAYVRVAKLSDSFIKFDVPEMPAVRPASYQPDEETVRRLIGRYTALFFEHADRVDKSNVEISAGQLSGGYTQLEIRMDGKDLLALARDFMNELHDDRDVEDVYCGFLESAGMSQSEVDESFFAFLDSIEKQQEKLNAADAKSPFSQMTLDAFVDGNGDIVGHRIRLEKENGDRFDLGYAAVTKLTNFGLKAEMALVTDGTERKLSLDGDGSVSLNGDFSGSFDLRAADPELDNGGSKMKVLKIKLSGSIGKNALRFELALTPSKDLLDLAKKDAAGLTEELEKFLDDLSLKIKGEFKEGSAGLGYAVMIGRDELLSLQADVYKVQSFDVGVPAESVSYEDWAASLDPNKATELIGSLSDAGVPTEVIYGLVFSLLG